MPDRLKKIDEQTHALLAAAKTGQREWEEICDALFRILWSPVVGFALHDLATFKKAAPLDERHDAVMNWAAEHFRRAFEHLERVRFALGDGFGIVDAKRVKNPVNLRACLTTAVIRDARKECDERIQHPPIAPNPDSSGFQEDNPGPIEIEEPCIEQQETLDEMRKSLARLPARLREPFVYHVALGWTTREIGLVIGVSHTEAARRIKQAKEMLRQVERNKGDHEQR